MSATLTHLAQPSLTRLVVVDPRPGVSAGYYGAVRALAWPAKDPADILDYVADYSEFLCGDGDDGIAALGVQIFPAQPGDLQLVSSAADGDRAVVWVSGGFAGTVYNVTLSMVTQGGRHVVRTVQLPVAAIATPPVPPNTIMDQNGAAITTEQSAPITAG